MGRVKVTPKGKIKKNIPITRLGKKQYLKRRFAHVRKVDNAGKNNSLTQKYVKGNHTAGQSYARLGLASDPSAPKAVVAERKKRVRPDMKEEFSEKPAAKGSVGRPVSEQEGCMINNLLLKYGTNFKRMSMDHKLNPFQLTPQQIQRRVVNYLAFEKEAFPTEWAKLEAEGLVPDYSDPKLRKMPKKANE